MKATGIVRRIDELGRIVIPKEIRRTLRIREGDPLEIYTDREGGVILKKYSPIGELASLAVDFAEVLSNTLSFTAVICDRDTVIAASGKYKREYSDRMVSSELDKVMGSLITDKTADTKPIRLVTGEDIALTTAQEIVTILTDGQPIGAIALVSRNDGQIDASAKVAATAAAAFLGKQMQQ